MSKARCTGARAGLSNGAKAARAARLKAASRRSPLAYRKPARRVRRFRASPKSRAAVKLEREVRHKSEDLEDQVLLDAVQAIRRRVRVINRDYDIPYIAGYSVDGDTVFIDRHLPRTFRWLMKTV